MNWTLFFAVLIGCPLSILLGIGITHFILSLSEAAAGIALLVLLVGLATLVGACA